ncbi:MAG TPA: Hsp20/alpha crystallin family protein [Chloroflexota bacterium]|mgnify:CR=1 FL=1
MAAGRWEPLTEMRPLREWIERFFEESLRWPGLRWMAPGVRLLPVDLYETPDAYILKASVAGVKPEDIDILATEQSLTISAERKEPEVDPESYLLHERFHGRFRREVSLPKPIDRDAVSARVEAGELTVVLPKTPRAAPRRIELGGREAPEVREGD